MISNKAGGLYEEGQKYGISDPTIQLLLKDFTDTELEETKKICFIMFSPDAVARKAIDDVLFRYNLVILKHKFINLRNYCEEVYQSDILSRRLHSWWIKNKIFNLGNTFVALVTCPNLPATSQSIYQYILSIKGASDPSLCKKETVRYEYRVTSKAFGFMHSSDDYFSSLREALLFFSPQEICSAIALLNHKIVATPKHAVSYKPQILELNFYYLLYTLKSNIFQSIQNFCDANLRDKIISIYDRGLMWSTLNLPYNEEKIQYAQLQDSEYKLLSQCFSGEYIQQLLLSDRETLSKIIIICRLSNIESFSKINSEELLREIEGQGFLLDEWEKLLLISSLFFYNN